MSVSNLVKAPNTEAGARSVASRLAALADLAPPDLARAAARDVTADTLACVLAGRESGPARSVEAMLATGTGPVSALGGPVGLTSEAAALLDATRGHAQDFDDVSYAGIQHGSVVIVPAALATAQEVGAEGAALVDAVAVGSEVSYALGRVVGSAVYDSGWWATGVLSGIGAAAACARLRGLDQSRTAHAIGLAALGAGGFRRFFGTAAKAYGAGRVAEVGVGAARAAAHGIDAPHDIFEGPNGFLSMFRPDTSVDLAPLDEIGRVWSLVTPGVAVKPWPVCSCASAVIEAVAGLREELGFAPDDVVCIDIRITAMVADALVFDRPTEPLHLLFSLPYAAALAATNGTVTPRDISTATLDDDGLATLAARVAYRVDPTVGDPARAPEACAAEVTLRDGRRAARAVDLALGDPSRPLSPAAFRAKLAACVERTADPAAVVAALETVDAPDGPARLISLCAPRAEDRERTS